MKHVRLLLLIASCLITVATQAETNDYPLAPENATATLSNDFTSVTVSWDAVGEIGEFGGHVDAEQVVYYIFDAFGSIYDPAIAVTADTSYTFDYSYIEGQDFVAYQVTAGVGESWFSLASSTNIVCVGRPYVAPWCESFESGKQQYAWLIDQNSSAGARTSIGKDAGASDGDGGYLKMTTSSKGQNIGIISAKINIREIEKPVLSLDYQGDGNLIEVCVAVDSSPLEQVLAVSPEGNSWSEALVSLAECADAEYITFSITYTSTDKAGTLLVDRIAVRADEGSFSPAAINPTDGSVTEIFTLEGKRVSSSVDNLQQGVYIVRSGDTVRKILR